jgi:acetylornithine deacetylase
MTSTSRLTEAVAIARREVVPLLQQMLSFDCDIASYDDPPRGDRAHQEFVAGVLEDLGLVVELFEPDSDLFSAHPLAPPGQTFTGRPILWARLPGRGEGPSLMFNGHYDTVPAGPLADWTRSPRGDDVVDGKVYGRGATDMKGGNAAALAAVVGLARAGVELPGDVIINFVPFEEVNGIGTVATVLSGRRADAAIVGEPTELRPVAGARGVMEFEVEVPGRAAHAEIAQPHHSAGGAVNAIDKLVELLLGIRRLNEQWLTQPDKQHPLLSTPRVLPTILEAGTFWASWPASAIAQFDVTYLPGEADSNGGGALVRAEVERHLDHIAATDDWLVDHPPIYRWRTDLPPADIDPDEPIVKLVVEHSAHPEGVGGLDAWADHVSLVNDGQIPSILLGPGRGEEAHMADEFVSVAALERCTELYINIADAWGRTGPSGIIAGKLNGEDELSPHASA